MIQTHCVDFGDVDLNEVESVLRPIRSLLAEGKIVNRCGLPEPTIPVSQKHIDNYTLQCLLWAIDIVRRELSFLLQDEQEICSEISHFFEVFRAVNETIESLEAGSREGREDEGEENAKEGTGEAF